MSFNSYAISIKKMGIKWNSSTELLKKYVYFFGNISVNGQRYIIQTVGYIDDRYRLGH